MLTKLTLTLNNQVIENAKIFSKQNNISLSKLVEFYFKKLTSSLDDRADNIPPITKQLSGIAEIDKTLPSDKKLLEEALNKKFL